MLQGRISFGLPMSTCTDAINNNGVVVHRLRPAKWWTSKANITVKSDATRQGARIFPEAGPVLPGQRRGL